MIFYSMKPAYGQHPEAVPGALLRRHFETRGRCIYSHAPDNNFRGINSRVTLQNETPVKLRNGYAKIAVFQLGVEVCRMQQQIGTVQRHAVADTQQSRRHQSNPGREIPVVYMYVFYAAFF